MASPLLTLQNVDLTFGGTPLLESAELMIHERDRIALVGRNGSGKSTLLKIAASLVEADRGTPIKQSGVTMRYLPQQPDLSQFNKVEDYVRDGLEAGNDDHRVLYLLGELGLNGSENPSELSGGEQRRAALARVLAPEPDILFLDEPTNHLDLATIEWLEGELASLRSAFVLISHDRAFLNRLTTSTVWLDRGACKRLSQGFAHFEEWRDKTYEEEDAERHKLDRKIVREEHWLTYGVTARRKRNVRRLGGLHALRAERQNLRQRTGQVDMQASVAEQTGKQVIEAKNIDFAYDQLPLVKDFSIKINRKDRIGIVGPNGAGKTTLIKLLTGGLQPQSGSVKLGTNLQMLTIDQKRELLDPNASLRDTLTGGGSDTIIVGETSRHVASYMKDFLFSPEQAGTAINRLSGGEQARALLAKSLAQPSNLLILDEPTNDLDLDTLDLLQELIADYSGTVILVSHDRDFIDRTVTSTLMHEGNGHWQLYAGGYQDMLMQRGSSESSLTATQQSSKQARKNKNKFKPKGVKKPSGQKLNFNQQHALKTLPAAIEALQTKIENFGHQLSDPNLFSNNPDKFSSIMESLAKAQTALEENEEQWLELEMLKEQVEG